jgi:hypothetical protein
MVGVLAGVVVGWWVQSGAAAGGLLAAEREVSKRVNRRVPA